MSDAAVRVDGLGKEYQLGRTVERYPTLRDALMRGAAQAARTIATLGRNHGRQGPERFWALRDVSLEIGRGEVVGIVGRNGAGKSTLLKILARVTEPTEGSARLRGRIGSLLEVGTGFHPELTGRENTLLNGAILGMRRAEILRKFDEIVAFAEVERFIDTPVKHYSSGMYLRLAFAVAAHLEPEILLVDEVLAVGDAAFQKKCIGKMSEVSHHGRTVLFVSHNMDAVQRLCTRSVLLEHGRVAMYEDTPAVVARYFATSGERPAPGDRVDLSAAVRRGSGEARFVEARYAGAAEGVGLVEPDGPLTVTAVIESDVARTVESVALTIRSRVGAKLVNADTIALGQSVTLRQGRSEVSLRIDALHLNPGAYSVALWLSRAAGPPIDYIESAFELDVVRARESGFGLTPTADGLVPCTFQVSVA
ncbi:MAG TPA: ABC transporter ATP-binding protein [Gemmatimonadaceae bacterium]|nr:ABC transporter ATP-binding protein [Gemmatimonadaceae bacterium]